MADFTLAPLLRKCSDDDLEPLVKFIKKAELTETLSESYGYCTHYPKHSKYADQIAHHIRLFGGNPRLSTSSEMKDHPMKRLCET